MRSGKGSHSNTILFNMGLARFEQRLERLVEGAFAKAFRSEIAPVEIGRRVTREMDLQRTVGLRGIIAPNHFTVLLSPNDYQRFTSFLDALTRELADAAREHARDERYSFIGPVHVDFREEKAIHAGTFRVVAELRGNPGGTPAGSLVLPDGRRIELGEDSVSIGRLPECEVSLSDPNISRRHAEIRREGHDFVIADLGSTNGTRVNGVSIKTRRLADGDEVSVGANTIRFEAS